MAVFWKKVPRTEDAVLDAHSSFSFTKVPEIRMSVGRDNAKGMGSLPSGKRFGLPL